MRGPSDLLALTPPPPAPPAPKPAAAPPKPGEFSQALTAAKKKSKPAASKQASKSAKSAPKAKADSAAAKDKKAGDEAKKQPAADGDPTENDASPAERNVATAHPSDVDPADAVAEDAETKTKGHCADEAVAKANDATDEPSQPVKTKAKASPDAGKTAASKNAAANVAAQAALQQAAAKQPQQLQASAQDSGGESADTLPTVSPIGQDGNASGPVLQAEQPATKVAAGKTPAAQPNADGFPQAVADLQENDAIAGDDAVAAPAGAAKPAKASADLKMPAIPDGSAAPKQTGQAVASAKAAPALPPAPPETQFAEANHPKLVSGMRGQLLPGGGTMQIRLDPPQLGDLQVTVKMINGVMTASFQTSNDEATRLLSHSLGQLKQTLETQGISVEKLHVTQAPKTSHSGSGDDAGGRQQPEARSGQQEQQRREMMRRMWRRMSIGRDPLDMVA